jgi:hypothetical protein
MNKKFLVIAVALMAVAMLAAPLIGNAEACCYGRRWRRPAVATVEYSIQVWPALPLPADYEPITGDNIAMGFRNLATFGNPPLVEIYPPDIASYGKGGIQANHNSGRQ